MRFPAQDVLASRARGEAKTSPTAFDALPKAPSVGPPPHLLWKAAPKSEMARKSLEAQISQSTTPKSLSRTPWNQECDQRPNPSKATALATPPPKVAISKGHSASFFTAFAKASNIQWGTKGAITTASPQEKLEPDKAGLTIPRATIGKTEAVELVEWGTKSMESEHTSWLSSEWSGIQLLVYINYKLSILFST